MKPFDFFVEKKSKIAPKDFFPSPANLPRTTTELNEDLLTSLRRGSIDGTDDVRAALALLNLVRGNLEDFSTTGEQTLTNSQIEHAIRTLEAVTTRVGVNLKLPFRDFTSFRAYWIRNDAYGSREERLKILNALFEPPRDQLTTLDDVLLITVLPRCSLAHLKDPADINKHLKRIQRTITDDPIQILESSKELIESTAKITLETRGLPVDDQAGFPSLVNAAQQVLGLCPVAHVPYPTEHGATKQILMAASAMANAVGELHDLYTKGCAQEEADTRLAHLAANAATTWCQLVLDTLTEEKSGHQEW